MTPQRLGEAVKKELVSIFESMLFKSVAGDVPMNVFLHELPAKTQKNDPYHCPNLLVHVGEISDDGEKRVCEISIGTILYCDDPDYQGESDVLHVLETIYQNFTRKGAIENFMHEYPIDYGVEDGSLNAPYYLGALHTAYEIPRMTMDDHEQHL